MPDGRWLDLEAARRLLSVTDPGSAHNDALFRAPVTSLEMHLAAGRRVEALRSLVEPFLERPDLLPPGDDPDADDDLALDARDLRFGPPILRPTSFRDFYAFEGHVRTMWARRGQEIPEAWYRLPIF